MNRKHWGRKKEMEIINGEKCRSDEFGSSAIWSEGILKEYNEI